MLIYVFSFLKVAESSPLVFTAEQSSVKKIIEDLGFFFEINNGMNR